MDLRTKIIIGLILFIFGVVSYGAVGWKAYSVGDKNGANRVQTLWDKSVDEAVDKKLDTKAKQDEIQNAPIDSRVTVRRLSNGTF